MARYIDADVLLARLKKLADEYLYAESNKDKYDIVYGALTGVRQAITYTKTTPAADVVEVVRCKDCIHAQNMPLGLCYLHTEPYDNAKGYKGDAVCVEPDDFCSYGRKKGE
jgi:hypothetical protein